MTDYVLKSYNNIDKQFFNWQKQSGEQYCTHAHAGRQQYISKLSYTIQYPIYYLHGKNVGHLSECTQSILIAAETSRTECAIWSQTHICT